MNEGEGVLGPIKPADVSLDQLKDSALGVNRGPTSPLDRQIEREETAENEAGARLAAEVKIEREQDQGLTDAEVASLADEFLKQHGFGEGIDPDLK